MTADGPLNSRLFILCSPKLSVDEIRKEFEPFGTIVDAWLLHHRDTKQPKGICYIKYSKASEACRAFEAMDKKAICGEPRPIAVKVATPTSEQNQRTSYGEEIDRLCRVFIRIPSETTQDGDKVTVISLTSEFEKYGRVVDCQITRSCRNAFITFEKPSQAATAIEECNKEYRAVFADPKRGLKGKNESGDRRSPSPFQSKRARSNAYNSAHEHPYYSKQEDNIPPAYNRPMDKSGNGFSSQNVGSSREALLTTMANAGNLSNNPNRCSELYLKINYPLSRESAWRLCNLVPGLDSLELVKTVGENAQLQTIFIVRYTSSVSASWAWEKMQDLEYPPGSYIRVRYADAGFPRDWDLSNAMGGSSFATSSFSSPMGMNNPASIDYANGPSFRPSAAISPGFNVPNSFGMNAAPSSASADRQIGATYDCSAQLSYPKPMLPKSTPYVSRLYFVCTKPIPYDILEDAFSSFGHLIDVYMISGKNCGYILYGSERAAEAALATLHDQRLAGSTLKIMQAQPEPSYKR